MEENVLAKVPIPYVYERMFQYYRSVKMNYQMNSKVISDLYYEMENVKGIDYTKEKGSFSKEKSMNKYHMISDKIDKYEKENITLKAYLDSLEKVCDGIRDPILKNAVRDRFMDQSRG